PAPSPSPGRSACPSSSSRNKASTSRPFSLAWYLIYSLALLLHSYLRFILFSSRPHSKPCREPHLIPTHHDESTLSSFHFFCNHSFLHYCPSPHFLIMYIHLSSKKKLANRQFVYFSSFTHR